MERITKSPWASPTVPVLKKDPDRRISSKDIRLAIDYRRPNAHIKTGHLDDTGCACAYTGTERLRYIRRARLEYRVSSNSHRQRDRAEAGSFYTVWTMHTALRARRGILPSAFLGLYATPINRSLQRGVLTAFLVLAGAEESSGESNYRVVKINKEKPIVFLPYNG